MRPLGAAALLLALGAAGPVRAAVAELAPEGVGFRIEVPATWTEAHDLVPPLVRDLERPDRLGGAPYRAGGAAFLEKRRDGALYVLWLAGDAPVEGDVARVVRRELDDVVERAVVSGGEVLSVVERVSGRVASTRVEVRRPELGTRTVVTAAVFVDARRHARAVQAECVLEDGHLAAVRPPCERALASLAVTLRPEQLLELPALPPPAPRPAPSPAVSAPASGPDAAKIGPVLVPPEPPSAWATWLTWGGAALVVAAIAIYATQARRRRKA